MSGYVMNLATLLNSTGILKTKKQFLKFGYFVFQYQSRSFKMSRIWSSLMAPKNYNFDSKTKLKELRKKLPRNVIKSQNDSMEYRCLNFTYNKFN